MAIGTFDHAQFVQFVHYPYQLGLFIGWRGGRFDRRRCFVETSQATLHDLLLRFTTTALKPHSSKKLERSYFERVFLLV